MSKNQNLDINMLLDWLQNRRRIDVLLILYENGQTSWGQADALLKAKGRQISDGTFRRACQELVKLGLASNIPMDAAAFKHEFYLTEKGCILTSIIQAAVRDLTILCESPCMG
jgi:DNA-binding HxlR family transcriptional regulator